MEYLEKKDNILDYITYGIISLFIIALIMLGVIIIVGLGIMLMSLIGLLLYGAFFPFVLVLYLVGLVSTKGLLISGGLFSLYVIYMGVYLYILRRKYN